MALVRVPGSYATTSFASRIEHSTTLRRRNPIRLSIDACWASDHRAEPLILVLRIE
jgi:hypothetical protein